MQSRMLSWFWYSNLHIVAVASALLLGTHALAGQKLSAWYLLLACSGVLLIYHVDRAFLRSNEDVRNAPERLQWYETHRAYLFGSSVITIVCGIVAALQLPLPILAYGAVIGALGVLYSVPQRAGGRRLKDIPLVKNLLILTCWVGGVVVIPLYGDISPKLLGLLATYRVLYLIPNLLVADWVDAPGDVAKGEATQKRKAIQKGITVYLRLAVPLVGLITLMLISAGISWHLVLIDVMGLIGLVWILVRHAEWTPKHVVMMDFCIGISMVTWLFWILLG